MLIDLFSSDPTVSGQIPMPKIRTVDLILSGNTIRASTRGDRLTKELYQRLPVLMSDRLSACVAQLIMSVERMSAELMANNQGLALANVQVLFWPENPRIGGQTMRLISGLRAIPDYATGRYSWFSLQIENNMTSIDWGGSAAQPDDQVKPIIDGAQALCKQLREIIPSKLLTLN